MSEDMNEFAAVAITDDKLVPWPRVAAVAAMVAFSLPTFITGLEVSQGLSPINAVWESPSSNYCVWEAAGQSPVAAEGGSRGWLFSEIIAPRCRRLIPPPPLPEGRGREHNRGEHDT